MFKKLVSIFICLIVLIPSIIISNPSITSAATAKIDQLIYISSYYKKSDGSIVVKYKIKKGYSSNESLRIGYEWPSQYRGSLKNQSASVSRSTGYHTVTLPKPSAHVGRLTFKVYYKANGGRYSESKKIFQLFHAPSGTKTTYHTVTKSEVYGDLFVYYAVPGAYFEFSPSGKWVKVLSRTYLGWSLWDNLSGRTSLGKGFPHPSEGQYYKIQSWYANYRLYTRVYVWDSKEAYKKGVKAKGPFTTYYSF